MPICGTVDREQSLNFLQRIRSMKVGYKMRVASRETRESSEISEFSRPMSRFLADARVPYVPSP